ncbi:RHS repeat domain-containing protein [Paenibacillus sp. NPDC057886]|uniref:RHS repeat domain-containing protein n=1 Tax=Paenibacillus sp. NPDC057886 TaxID=3346270 RepID=UPI0036AAB5DC
MEKDDGKQTYIYDVLNQLVEVKDQSGQRIQQYSYDEQRRRTQSASPYGTINFFYEGNDKVQRFDGIGKGHINKITKQNVPTPHVNGKSIPERLDQLDQTNFQGRGRDDEYIKMASELVL